jgi:uncharacterized repeat protein (TIGR01451 family)
MSTLASPLLPVECRKELSGVNRSTLRFVLLVCGVLLILLAMAPTVPAAYAISLAALTPTVEPPTRTPPGGTPVPTLPPRPTVQPPAPTATTDPTAGTPKPDVERADPSVTKEVSPSEAHIGDIVDFTITVTNHGGETADDVVVTDQLPDFLDVVETTTSKGTIATSGRTVVTTIGSVAPDEVVVIHIRAQVNAQALPPGGRNSVSLASSNNSDDPDNNTDSVTIGILTSAASPTATPTEVVATPAAATPSTASAAAGASNRPGQAPPARPNLPATGAGDTRSDISWPLALLGVAMISLSLFLHRRRASKL